MFWHLFSLWQLLIDGEIVLSNIKLMRWALLTAHFLFKTDFVARPNFSGNSWRSRNKRIPSVTGVLRMEGASDITCISSSLKKKLYKFLRTSFLQDTSGRLLLSLSSALLGVICIHPSMWAKQRGTVIKENFSISPMSIFYCKARNKILRDTHAPASLPWSYFCMKIFLDTDSRHRFMFKHRFD